MQAFQWWGFFMLVLCWLTTVPETRHIWDWCWGDISGSKVLKSDYRWLQWFQGMAVPSRKAGPGCAGAFADSSIEFSWPCLAETHRTQGHHLVQNKAFPRLFHTMPSACSCPRKMHVQGWLKLGAHIYSMDFLLCFPKQEAFSTYRLHFFPARMPLLDPLESWSCTPTLNNPLLSPKEPPAENYPASINPSL